MTTTLYLIRHGRTALNAAGMLRGRIDAPLDAVGRDEASRLGALFVDVRLHRIVSSPLSRSFDTACAIAAPHGLDVDTEDGFIDRDYGPWAGHSQAEVEARYGSLDAAPVDEIEPLSAFEQRLATAVANVLAEADGKAVAIVAHDAVNRALIRTYCAIGPGPSASIPQPTGCWNRFLVDGKTVFLEVVGATPGDGAVP